ncbi:MAG: tetratricopeptide repeat protein, partial [candidate division WOR-3 bacterium]|nr:tetratricopeptide repeat protein [candidate division WOR-3 bacterium]
KDDIKTDFLQNAITKLLSLYYHNKRNFLIGLGVVGAIVVALIIGLSSRGGEHPEVQLRFTEALGIYSMAQSPEEYNAAEERFLEFTRRFGGHYLVGKAHFYLGNINYTRGDFKKAQEYFERAYKKLKNDLVLGPASLMGIANCFEEMQNLKKAADIYLKVYNRYKKSQLAPEALLACGRCYKLLGNYELAEKIYERALKEFEPGENAEKARAELAYIRALKNKIKS